MNTNIAAKQILVYGDSYVFGKIPGALRYDPATRFTGVLQNYLGSGYEIIEEGLRGRTLAGENGFFPHRNGLTQFDGILGSHLPLDLVMIFLGTNDCNSASNKTVQEMVTNYAEYLGKIGWWSKHLDFSKPKVMLIAPPAINEASAEKVLKNIFKGSSDKINALRPLLKSFVKENNMLYFDSSTVVRVSEIDGVHLDIENNHLLGRALAQFIKETL